MRSSERIYNGRTEMDSKDKLIAKIKKLMALTSSPNEHEAALAAEKMQAILAEHNLSMTDVKAAKEGFDGIKTDGDLRTNSFPWRRSLANAVAQMYFCKYFFVTHRKPGGNARSGHDSHHFVGASHNIEVAKMMFGYLNETVDRLAREGAKAHPENRSGYITSFTNACAGRLVTRIYDRIEAAKRGEVKNEAGKSMALVVLYTETEKQLQAYLDDRHGPMKSRPSRARLTNMAGTLDGRAAGDKIGLDQQVANNNAARRIASR